MGWLPDHIWAAQQSQKQQSKGKGNWLPDHIWAAQKQQKQQSSGKGNWLPDHIWLAQKKGNGGGKSWSSPAWKPAWKPAGKGGNGQGKFKKPINPSLTVWVGGIPEGTTFAELKAHVDSVAPCKWAEVYEHKGKGTGLIGFGTADEAVAAIAMLNGSEFKGLALEVDSYTKAKA
uniref:RNA-binding protein n=1 Tax=Karlodinium veneficum TaxID=407301 RepID=A7YXU5_KARVE|nr:RNA-binding protein [Karlodinium veneficum]|eukprot:CAMPEP_0169097326 /NCGR_PEP_ID=MMETSP1015-20121227/19464_1 /TAXON_ID=342587 /ORGANISM="Karlodinium micrum, Strain CCMP2283" /LENGTH=173 /DNA_ID=CAMNT_0009158133 /DNA_START=52 /DNA_END=573 /DNA_ORIENTATION=-